MRYEVFNEIDEKVIFVTKFEFLAWGKCFLADLFGELPLNYGLEGEGTIQAHPYLSTLSPVLIHQERELQEEDYIDAYFVEIPAW